MILARSHDAQVINAILNHPDVHRWLAFDGIGHIDAGPLLTPENIALLVWRGDAVAGCFLYMQRPYGHEVHAQMLPGFRGPLTVQAARASIAWLWTHTDSPMISATIAADNPAANALARHMGFSRVATIDTKLTRHGRAVPHHCYELQRGTTWE